jgi:hypothetical protein
MPLDATTAMAVDLTNAVFALQKLYPDSSPREMLTALIKVMCGYAATHRIDDQSPEQMGSWLAAYVHSEFHGAHRHISRARAQEDPEKEMAKIWQPSPKPTNSHFQAWEVTRRLGLDPVRWSLILPNGDSLDGLTTEAAAISARAHLRPMWAALVEPPADLYEAFHTDGKAWGFFDREGNLHAQFPSRADAAGCAARREDADYASN